MHPPWMPRRDAERVSLDGGTLRDVPRRIHRHSNGSWLLRLFGYSRIGYIDVDTSFQGHSFIGLDWCLWI